MNLKDSLIKIIFGIIIFIFGLALAYFSASYLERQGIDQWLVLSIFAIIYVILGLSVYTIFPISLGFLFSADILLINLLSDQYSGFSIASKAFIMGLMLVILYVLAWQKYRD